ncbi:hypothetical protein TMP248_140008 [Tenacibaculum maritimum]|uniref:hypothetical protein n=1 Tax=Tenacibaculum maritimum TaxID=107401 RepID=UPI0012E64725|nr:hypothetical protein [Tenacibaculum maritimum]CAA0172095.1 hypothetical protein TMP248_140008 [Tenacibaculum maritimum]
MRTIIKEICTTRYNETVCVPTAIPIREWNIDPEIINEKWLINGTLPNRRLVTVIFPDVVELQEYNDINFFRYAIEFPQSNFINLTSPILDLSNIAIPSNGVVQFEVSYKNFNQLSNDITLSSVTFAVYGSESNGNERLLEKRELDIIVEKTTAINEPYITTDKPVYRGTYFLHTQTFSESTLIQVLPVNIDENGLEIRRLPSFSASGSYANNISFSNVFGVNLSKIFKIENPNELLGSGVIEIPCEVTCAVSRKNANNILFSKTAQFKIAVEVLPFDGDFTVSKSDFDFLLKYHENKKGTGTIIVINNNNIDLTIESSYWINVTENNNHLSFETIPAKDFTDNENSGFIKISGGSTVKIINISVAVEKSIVANLEKINFCLDDKPILVVKKSDRAIKLRMNLTMNFVGYNSEKETINQIYEYVFFDGKVYLYPGEEVQDFFNSIETVESIRVNELGIPVSKELFYACQTDIEITELDSDGNSFEKYNLEKVNYLPGKKPKAYPYLTNGTVRRTYTDSLVSISAIKDDFIISRLGEIASNLVDNSNLKSSIAVCNISFKRSLADRSYGDRDVIQKSKLSLHPIPNTQTVISVVFQNQNFCPDWFSFSGEYEEIPILTHTIAENLLNSSDFKAETEQDKTIKLNTGWLFEEEIKVLWELINSPICFIHLNNIWIKAIPISTKPLPFNSQKNINSQIVEFKIIDDER